MLYNISESKTSYNIGRTTEDVEIAYFGDTVHHSFIIEIIYNKHAIIML